MNNLDKIKEFIEKILKILKYLGISTYSEKEDESLNIIDLSIDLNKFNSSNIKAELVNIQNEIKNLIKENKAVKFSSYLKDKRSQYNIKQLIRTFDSETILLLDNLTIANFDSKIKKLAQIKNQLDSLYKYDNCSISDKFYKLKQQQLLLAVNYLKKVEEEKEQKKYIKEQLLEEEKVRRELEKKKAELEKESKSFNNELKRLYSYLQKNTSDIEKQLYIDKIKELENKLNEISKDIKDVENRQSNTRAGYVYIISNIGSFGEDVYKIGVTRRLEPMDRINELSSASVPFKFDVHAIIFSDDAPALETALHQAFEKQKVNKINPRKEFFRINLEKIKEEITKNYNKTVEYIDIPEAYEFRETLKINNQNN